MSSARYWRVTNIAAHSSAYLELSALELWANGAKVTGTLSCAIAPVTGTLSNLSDADLGTTAKWLICPGLAFVFDLGSSATVQVPRMGAAGKPEFVASCQLEYSADGQSWLQEASYSQVVYPGAGVLTGDSTSLPTESPNLITALAGQAESLSTITPPDFGTYQHGNAITLNRGELSGWGRIAGTVKVTPASPVKRRVRLHREVDGLLVSETWSDPATGAYQFDDLNPEHDYTVLSYDHTAAYRAVVADRVIPEPMT